MSDICLITVRVIPEDLILSIRAKSDMCLFDILNALEKRFNKTYFVTLLESYNSKNSTFISLDPDIKTLEVKDMYLVAIPMEWID